MTKLFYIETRPDCILQVVSLLKRHGLVTDAVEAHYNYYQRRMHGELIMWAEGDKYPSFVHRSQESLVIKCGTKINY